MKRQLLFFLLAMACPFVSVSAQTYEAVYVYMNDGGLNAFLKSDLDSIRFSTCDVDGMEHATWQTQEFYTPDSVYRIPFSKIDSVRMVTPDPVLAQGVSLGRDSWLKYVKTYTEQTIILNADIPTELIPKVGQVLLAYPNEEPIKEGFSGRVRSVTTAASGIVCSCEEVGISDLYERILIVGKAESENTEATENQSRGQKRDFATGTNEKVYIPPHLPGTLKVGDNLSVEVSLENPSLTLDYLLCYGEENLKDMVYFKYQFSADGNISVAANISKDYEPEPREFAEIPVNFYGLTGSLVFATYFKASGSMDLSFGMPVHVTSVDGFKYIEGEGFSALGERYHNATWDKPEWSVSLDGSLETGLAISLAAGIVNRKFASIDLTTYVGPKVSSSFTITQKEGMNTTLYDMLKDVEVTTSLGVTFEPGYRVWFKERENLGGEDFSFDFLKTTRPLLPKISTPEWKAQGSGTGVLTADVAKDIFIPVKLGWVLYDGDKIHDKSYLNGTYWMENDWHNPNMSYTLNNLSGNYNYKAYPVVRLFNKLDIRVPEYAEVMSENICPDDHHPHMIDIGLPSGTKWACCNVGATTPEGYGGYYAWGETWEKSYYDFYSHKYSYSYSTIETVRDPGTFGDDEWHDVLQWHYTYKLPNQICGTSYDVAYVNWGDSWQMPTIAQQSELLDYCTSTWTTRNGVNGRLFTGPNGGQVFLPAAGYRLDGEFVNVGSCGLYWSGISVNFIGFDSGIIINNGGDASFGYSVRPVAR